MRLDLRMKYLEKTYKRYKNASKESKTKILDELAITNMKHQIETGTADSKLLDRQLA